MNYEESIEKYSDMMLRVAFQIVKNQHDAQDVCQEVFVKLLKSKKEFETDEYEKAWLIRVTMNTAKDYVKSFWYRNRAELSEEIAVYDNEHLYVVEEIMRLPVKYWTPIYLYYYEGYSVREIAKILQRSENTVLTWLSRGRKKLQDGLMGGFADE